MEDQSQPLDTESSLALELGRALLDAYRRPAGAKVPGGPGPAYPGRVVVPGDSDKRSMATEVDRIDRALTEGQDRIIRLFDGWGSNVPAEDVRPVRLQSEGDQTASRQTESNPTVGEPGLPVEHEDGGASGPLEISDEAEDDPVEVAEQPGSVAEQPGADEPNGRPIWLVNAIAALTTALVVTVALLIVNSI